MLTDSVCGEYGLLRSDCNDGYTQATDANVCCENITGASSYDGTPPS